ncbi:MAG: phage tail sheath C-terminal domain-containing protein [Chloroflexota bacterium]
MPEYLAPGVYVEEVSSGAKPIEGVSTSTAGFVGLAERGPESPQFITSWTEFQRIYGGYVPNQSYLAYAVEGFFINGGQRCFVTRVVAKDAKRAQKTINKLTIAAIGRGQAGAEITVTVAPASQPNQQKLTVQYGEIVEVYDNLTHTAGATNNIATTLNNASNLVRAWWAKDQDPEKLKESTLDNNTGEYKGSPLGGKDLDGKLAVDMDAFVGYDTPVPLSVEVDTKGTPKDKTDDGTPVVTNAPNEEFGRSSGLMGLSLIDEIALLVVPDEVDETQFPNNALTLKVVEQCQALKDRFAIVSAPQGAVGKVTDLRPPLDTTYAGFYFPWIKIFDPSINSMRLIPSTGHIAGIFARTDIERGVHKAPANEVVRGAVDLQAPVTKGMQDLLNPRHVNCMRDFRSDGRGIRLWGARTMSSDPEWKYVNVRRLFMFVEESIDEGTQWVVFEPNDDATWAKIRRVVTDFLISVWRSGALMGLTQDEAFFVRCDRTTMTQNDIDNGRLVCVIGIAPVKPAEFVIFRISQKTAEAPA